jgi:hypothetical protein
MLSLHYWVSAPTFKLLCIDLGGVVVPARVMILKSLVDRLDVGRLDRCGARAMAASGAGEGVTASIWRVIIALGGHAVGIIGGSARLAAQRASLDGRRASRDNALFRVASCIPR